MALSDKQWIEVGHIADDSWSLINTEQLPPNASKAHTLAALKADQQWLENHIQMISARIDKLIHEVEFGEESTDGKH